LASLNKLKAQGRIKGFHVGIIFMTGVAADVRDVWEILVSLMTSTMLQLLPPVVLSTTSWSIPSSKVKLVLNIYEKEMSVEHHFIKPKDPRFAAAFYKGLYNTLVADDMTQAQRIGYGKKRWRVVTLAGQLIDPSGTMSGGGTRVQRGGMSSKFVPERMEPEVVARYEHDLASAEQEWQAWQMEKKTAEAELVQLRKRLPEIEIALEKIELDVSTANKRIKEGEKHLAELQYVVFCRIS
jgi:structural maintenance of chromosome 4